MQALGTLTATINAPQRSTNLPGAPQAEQSNPLPSRWIERIFARFESHYGAKLADQWAGADIATVKRAWCEALGGFSQTEVVKGVEACMTRPWPPTLPEFLNLCRPPFDYEAAYHHAGEQVRLRAYQCDRWNSPAIYWAASELGNDLREPYQRMKGRWAAAVDAARRGIASGRLDSCVPPCMPAIAPPPPSSIDERRRRINEISLTFGSRKHAATLEQKSISNVAPT